MCFPGDSVVKNLPASAGGMGLTPGLGRSSGEENGNPLQYSCQGSNSGLPHCRWTLYQLRYKGSHVASPIASPTLRPSLIVQLVKNPPPMQEIPV